MGGKERDKEGWGWEGGKEMDTGTRKEGGARGGGARGGITIGVKQ